MNSHLILNSLYLDIRSYRGASGALWFHQQFYQDHDMADVYTSPSIPTLPNYDSCQRHVWFFTVINIYSFDYVLLMHLMLSNTNKTFLSYSCTQINLSQTTDGLDYEMLSYAKLICMKMFSCWFFAFFSIVCTHLLYLTS